MYQARKQKQTDLVYIVSSLSVNYSDAWSIEQESQCITEILQCNE